MHIFMQIFSIFFLFYIKLRFFILILFSLKLDKFFLFFCSIFSFTTICFAIFHIRFKFFILYTNLESNKSLVGWKKKSWNFVEEFFLSSTLVKILLYNLRNYRKSSEGAKAFLESLSGNVCFSSHIFTYKKKLIKKTPSIKIQSFFMQTLLPGNNILLSTDV